MATKSLPEQLHRALTSHLEESDLRADEELTNLLDKLSGLSEKVAAAKAQVIARRKNQSE